MINIKDNNEISFHSFEDALSVAEILVKNSYCVMISEEENLVILNYEWTEGCADRNQMVFRNESDLILELEEIERQEEEFWRSGREVDGDGPENR